MKNRWMGILAIAALPPAVSQTTRTLQRSLCEPLCISAGLGVAISSCDFLNFPVNAEVPIAAAP